jgi:MFS family permease
MLQSMVNPVLPTIQAALDTDQRTVTWLLTAYLLSRRSSRRSSAASATRSARSGCSSSRSARCRRVAHRRVAPTIGVLIFARVVQGVGGGVLPLTFGIIRDEFPVRAGRRCDRHGRGAARRRRRPRARRRRARSSRR